MLATWLRDLPSAVATSSWRWSNSRIRPAVGTGFLQRVQVAALKVLDERDFDTLGLAQVADHRRQLVEARPLRRPPATFAGDDLVGRAAVVARPHHQRLDDALLADRGGQALDLGLVEVLARLIGMGRQVLDRD